MRSPTLALLWEIWRAKRGLIVAVVAMTLLGAYGRFTETASSTLPVDPGPVDSDPALFVALRLLSLLLLFGIFNYTESGDGRGFGGFPQRLFTLPVSTFKLVALPMLAGIVAIELHFLVWMDGTPSPGSASAVFYGVVMAACIVFYQVTLWTLERLRSMKLVVLGLLGFFMTIVSQLPSLPPSDYARVGWEQFLILVVASLAACAFLIGWHYVSRLRCGERGRPGSLLPIARLTDWLPRRSGRFATPAGAQLWFEWRTVGVLFPLLVIGVLVLGISPLLLLLGNDPVKVQNIVLWTLAMPIVLAHAVGIAISKPSLWDEGLGVPVITATKPLGTAELVAIRIRVATLSVAVAWAFVLVFLAVLPLWANVDALTGFASEWQAFHQGSVASVWIAVGLTVLAAVWLTWRFMVSTLWLGFAGSKLALNVLIVLVVLVPSVALILDAFRLPGWLLAEPGRLTALVWLIGLAVAAKYGLAALGWRRVPARLAAQYLLVAAVGTASFVLLWLTFRDVLGTYIPALGIDRVQTFLILTALLLMPLARPGFAPAMLARNRHR